MRMRATLAASLALGALLALVAPGAVSAAPETADAPEVWVSTDGVSFSRDTEALFSGARVLVPGDEIWATIWVRNGGEVPAVMRTSLRDLQVSSAQFAEALTLDLVDDQSRWSGTVDSLDECAVVGEAKTVAAGETIRLDIGVRMADVDGTADQNQALGMSMMVAMRDASAGAFSSTACQDDGVIVSTSEDRSAPGVIAHTGAPLPLEVFIAAGSLLGVGGFLVVAGRRRRRA